MKGKVSRGGSNHGSFVYYLAEPARSAFFLIFNRHRNYDFAPRPPSLFFYFEGGGDREGGQGEEGLFPSLFHKIAFPIYCCDLALRTSGNSFISLWDRTCWCAHIPS